VIPEAGILIDFRAKTPPVFTGGVFFGPDPGTTRGFGCYQETKPLPASLADRAM
jgi:hypothetical protein